MSEGRHKHFKNRGRDQAVSGRVGGWVNNPFVYLGDEEAED